MRARWMLFAPLSLATAAALLLSGGTLAQGTTSSAPPTQGPARIPKCPPFLDQHYSDDCQFVRTSVLSDGELLLYAWLPQINIDQFHDDPLTRLDYIAINSAYADHDELSCIWVLGSLASPPGGR